MTRGNYVLQAKIIRFFRENCGSPFIVAFVLLLLFAAISLSVGSSTMVNDVAVYAYYALIVGFILQLVCFLKDRKKVAVAEAL
jgi:hypothetical protein